MSYVSRNLMNHHGSAAVKNDFKSTYTKTTRCFNDKISSKIPMPILKNLTITPVSEVPTDSTKIMSLNKKGMGPSMFQSKERVVPSHLKISKEITITPINNTENNIMSMLKKLPDITFNVVTPEPVFKIPETPKQISQKINRTNDKLKTVIERKVLSDRQDNNIIINKNKNSKSFNTIKNLTEKKSSYQKSPLLKPVLNTINNTTTPKKKNYDTIISKTPNNKYSFSQVNNNTKRTSSPNKLTQKSQSFLNTETKYLNTSKPTREVSNTFSSSLEVKTISDNSLSIQITKNNTQKPANEDDLLVDLDTSSEVSNTFSSSHEMKKISDNSSSIHITKNNTPKPANEDYLLMDLSIEGQINIVPACPLDFNNVSLPEYDSFVMGISKSLQDNNINNTTDTSTVLEDNQLLREMRIFFCDNMIENIPEIESKSMVYPKPAHQILLNNIQGSSVMNGIENENGVKRSLPENEYYKKWKPNNENIKEQI